MTNTDLCADVISRYMEGLSVDFEATSSDDGCFLLTPFNRPDGEGIELEVEVLPSGNTNSVYLCHKRGGMILPDRSLAKRVRTGTPFPCSGVIQGTRPKQQHQWK